MHSSGMMPLRPSRQLAAALTLLHLGALACLVPLALALWLKAPAVLALLASLVFMLRRSALLAASDSIVALVPKDDGMIRYVLGDGEEIEAEVLPDTTVYRFAAVVLLRAPGARRVRSVLVLPDSMDAEAFRHLRVWLRWRSTVSRGAS
jgi:toxin CptA